MARFKLLAGAHVQNDPSGQSRAYSVGQVVVSDVDLVEKFGPMKFERVGGGEGLLSGTGNATPGDPVPEVALAGVDATFPHGQVGTGFQQTSGYNPTGVQSGPMDRDVAREHLKQQGTGDIAPQDQLRPGDTNQASDLEREGREQPDRPEPQKVKDLEPQAEQGRQQREEQATQQREQAQQRQQSTPQGQGQPQAQPQQQPQAPQRNKEEYHKQLDRMSLADLKKHAEEEEVDLKGASRRDEVLRVLKTQPH